LNIIITGTGFSFPDGTGATARVLSFARGLIDHGAAVHVFLPKPTENETSGARNPDLKGVYEGISFEYTCGQRLAARTRVGALTLYLKGLWRACRAIRREHRQTPVDAILLWYPEDVMGSLVFRTLATSIGAVLIAEKAEFPFVYVRNTVAVRATMWFHDRFIYRLFDGAIVISSFLSDYIGARLRKTAKLLHIPILVDTAAFGRQADGSKRDRPDPPHHCIIYIGCLDHDGEVAGLLRAFSEVAGDFPDWSVQIVGQLIESNWLTQLRALIPELGLDGRVEFAGHRPRRDIPVLLSEGDVMALPRAAGTFSSAGFPTKLGEYLASGKPVVVTATGDIPKYLQDGVNAYVTPPGDTAAFARALRRAMANPAEAAEVGRRGREVAIREFDPSMNCGRVIEFIRTLKTAG
jgi:glycosyltransferase involved in cell wall biosynthesis